MERVDAFARCRHCRKLRWITTEYTRACGYGCQYCTSYHYHYVKFIRYWERFRLFPYFIRECTLDENGGRWNKAPWNWRRRPIATAILAWYWFVQLPAQRLEHHRREELREQEQHG